MPRHPSYLPHGVIPAVLLPFDTDLAIDDKEMSRKHFVISPASAGYVIHDQNSQNGTLVNGRRIYA